VERGGREMDGLGRVCQGGERHQVLPPHLPAERRKRTEAYRRGQTIPNACLGGRNAGGWRSVYQGERTTSFVWNPESEPSTRGRPTAGGRESADDVERECMRY
jgi:hypothetical protein